MSQESEFWMQRPQAMGIRGWSLLIPAIASSVGFFCFAVLGFSFTELNVLPQQFRTALVLVGAFTLAFGSEVGTLANVVDIFRKGERLGGWDKLTLVVSVCSTMAAFILAFAELLGTNAQWSDTVRLWGPIALGVLAAFDSYGGFLEFGLYLNTYDQRLTAWREAKQWHARARFEQAESAKFALQERELDAKLAELETQLKRSNAQKTEETRHAPPSVDELNAARLASKQARVNAMIDAFVDNPHATQVEVAERVGVSRSTISNYLSELESDGVVRRNGDGVQVLMTS